MHLKPILAFALVLTFSLAARSDDAKDTDALQGTWLPSTAELGGKPFPEEVRNTIKLVVKLQPRQAVAASYPANSPLEQVLR
jgi:hypothetical protein